MAFPQKWITPMKNLIYVAFLCSFPVLLALQPFRLF